MSASAISPTASEVASQVIRRLQEQDTALGIYWVAVSDARGSYTDELHREFQGQAAMAIVVRGARFENPNCVFDDFVDLLRSERALVEQHLTTDHASDRCAVVLVSHSELSVVQASSPVVLPGWFPVCPGQTVTSRIEDLTWVVDAPLNADDARIPELCRQLFRLEGELLTRLRVASSDQRAVAAFFDRITTDSESWSDFLDGATTWHARVLNPDGYRPSLKEQGSLLSRLLLLVQKEKPAGLTKLAQALASALQVPEDLEPRWHEALPAVLGRPQPPDAAENVRFARGLLLTLTASAQYVTAAAHADAYRAYPVPLIRAMSYDLRRALVDAAAVVRGDGAA